MQVAPNFGRQLAVCSIVLTLVCGCGGGGGSSVSAPATLAPNASSNASSPNIDPSDAANNWTSSRFDPSGSGYNPAQTTITKSNVATLKPKWIFQGAGGSYSGAIVANGTVYYADNSGTVYALNESTGSEEWQFVTPVPDAFLSTLLYWNGMIYAPTAAAAQFYVLSASSGAELWDYAPQSGWGSPYQGSPLGRYKGSPVYWLGSIYEGAGNHWEPYDACMSGSQLMRFDPNSATTLATANLATNGTTGVGVWSAPVFDADGNMYAATGNTCSFTIGQYGDSMLQLNSSNLGVVWHAQGPVDNHDWDFGATPVVVGNLVVDGGKDGNVYAYNRQTGQLEWEEPNNLLGAVIAPLATDGTHIIVGEGVYGSSTAGEVVCYDLQGNVLWTVATGMDPNWPSHSVASGPVISQGIVYVAFTQANCTSMCDGISALDITTGKQLWRYATATPILGAISIVNGGLFAAEIDEPDLYEFVPTSSSSSTTTPRVIKGWPSNARVQKDYWYRRSIKE
jgi:outer membrane protein assembly factor BamB